ncbi:MAG TPA: hypothetical protein VFD64_18310 [Gemmatimonadaceae bacterium]|nr:hypothetical protein [Gemmatimonadaceae bacterium]
MSACDLSASQDLTGRWLHEENGESAEILLEHDNSTGKVNGTFIVLGKTATISGRADGSALVIEKVGDVVASTENGTMVGAISGEQMLLTITQPGQEIVILRLTRQPGSDTRVASTNGSDERSVSRREATPMDEEPFTPSTPEEFAGSWEAVSDDGTNTETAEFELADGGVRGTLRSLERGYYSGRVTVNAEVSLRGTPRGGALDLRAWDAQTGSPENAVAGRAVRRGDFLILRIGDGETGYARPGVAIVRSAEGSPEAASLAQAIAGRIYSASTQSSARGAFVGNRVRLSLCSDGNIAFDVSDLASTGGEAGVDMGDATSRRGQWSVVLRAGTPVVRAQWSGTGSSYSLTRYFRVQPHNDGSGARVDGTDLPVAGSC